MSISDERLAYMLERQLAGYLTITTGEITDLLTELQSIRAAAKVRAIREGDGEVVKPGWTVAPQAILDRWLDGYAFNDDSEEDCALVDQYRASMRTALAATPAATGGEKE